MTSYSPEERETERDEGFAVGMNGCCRVRGEGGVMMIAGQVKASRESLASRSFIVERWSDKWKVVQCVLMMKQRIFVRSLSSIFLYFRLQIPDV